MEYVNHLARSFRFKWFTSPGRWKGELYLIPCIRFAWGRELSRPNRSYWIGLYWAQWSIHLGWYEVL